ncbi:hypothetical protein [Brevundimonas aurantiaca]|nr:hypothetical protein [Brevundimonas aurantiaca]
MQSFAVFVAAWPRLPDLSVWQAAAAILTAALVALCAAGWPWP